MHDASRRLLFVGGSNGRCVTTTQVSIKLEKLPESPKK